MTAESNRFKVSFGSEAMQNVYQSGQITADSKD